MSADRRRVDKAHHHHLRGSAARAEDQDLAGAAASPWPPRGGRPRVSEPRGALPPVALQFAGIAESQRLLGPLLAWKADG